MVSTGIQKCLISFYQSYLRLLIQIRAENYLKVLVMEGYKERRKEINCINTQQCLSI
jgi:hypothetical protein